MKIAVISMIRDSWGGSEELWHDMAKVALSKDYVVMHLSYRHHPEHFKLAELKSSGLLSYQRPGITGNISGMKKFIRLSTNFVIKKVQKPVKKIFDQKPDVILYNGTCYSIIQEKEILNELKKFNGKFFLLCHFNERQSPLENNEKTTLKEVYQKCAKVFFTNHHDIETLENELNVQISNAMVLRNPVNLDNKTIIPFPGDEPTQIAMVGNLLIAHKGQDIAFNVLKKDTWKNRSWHLNIYGNGPDRNYLEGLCNEFHLEKKVSFHGRVNDIRTVWQKNHLHLMASRMEGMPLAIVEAMICGRPSIVTNVGGISEWVEEERSGFLTRSVSEDSLESALEKAWQQKNRWSEMGLYAHQKAMQLYDPNPGKTLLELMLN
jgi:glycosyltransferase involved in cell wall biosynthesis